VRRRAPSSTPEKGFYPRQIHRLVPRCIHVDDVGRKYVVSLQVVVECSLVRAYRREEIRHVGYAKQDTCQRLGPGVNPVRAGFRTREHRPTTTGIAGAVSSPRPGSPVTFFGDLSP
jgi:hypothetical protein